MGKHPISALAGRPDGRQSDGASIAAGDAGAEAAADPVYWFWPQGASSCALMTHDVETALGVDLCPMLMDVNDSFGIKASFQVIPEERYHVTPAFLQSIRDRGFEVVVHDLNHDGRLFRDRAGFAERATKINAYGKQFRAAGFRAGVLYRNQSGLIFSILNMTCRFRTWRTSTRNAAAAAR